MPKILTNETNLDSLKKAISKARKYIYLISPWIRSETLKKIFTEDIVKKIKENNIKIYIAIRLNNIEDLKITDEDVFKFAEELGENCEIRYNRDLHSKIYIVDTTYASIGSYNLTGGGFGDNINSGSNIETGIEIKDKSEISKFLKIVEEIWKNSNIIPDDLIGFTLNSTTHYKFTIAGIKPLETGKFVEIREDKNNIILGQIGEVCKFNFSFYNPPELSESNEGIADTFSNLNPLSNKLKGIAIVSNLQYGQLNIGDVHIIARFHLRNNEDEVHIEKEDNRFAPDVGKEVYEASKEILKKLFYNEYCHPAVLNSNRKVEVGLNPEELLSKHMAVFGTTGSGKSYFVKSLISGFLYDYILEKKNGRIIIFDPHGEYEYTVKNLMKKHKILYKNDWEKYLTFYIETAEDLINYFGIRSNSKAAGVLKKILNGSKSINNNNINTELNNYKDKGLDEDLINNIQEAVKNKEISFNQIPEFWKDFKDNKIYCINLRDCNELEDMWRIVSNIMTSIFNHSKSTRNFPTLFVIEEAHNFAPEGEGKNNEAGKIIRKVAREGRKFYNGLIVITQRPAYVAKDVLTQCSTQAIFRLINGNDINAIIEVVEGIGKNEAIKLPYYVQGQCIFTGVAIEMPVVVRIK